MPLLNPVIENLMLPPVPEVQGWAVHYNGKFGPLIDMSQAVPGYPPPKQMLNWLGEQAASVTMTSYGPIEGEDVLRNAYSKHVSTLYKANIKASQTHITSGCNQAFITAVMAVAGAGDAILMTNPFYFNHQTTLSMLGIETKYVEVDKDKEFLPDIEEIKSSLVGVKALALVSPNNPTGSIYPAKLLNDICRACRNAGVWLILDETYRDFIGENCPHDLFSQKDWSEVLIQLYSFSKSFCIPGHRLGAVVADERVIEGIAKVMDNLQICAPRSTQHAVAQAIEPLEDWRKQNRIEIEKRAHALRATLALVPDWQIGAIGAYFAYVKHPFNGKSSTEVAKKLAEDVGVSCLPGDFFGKGQEDYLRLAFANADSDTIDQLAKRLIKFEMN